MDFDVDDALIKTACVSCEKTINKEEDDLTAHRTRYLRNGNYCDKCCHKANLAALQTRYERAANRNPLAFHELPDNIEAALAAFFHRAVDRPVDDSRERATVEA